MLNLILLSAVAGFAASSDMPADRNSASSAPLTVAEEEVNIGKFTTAEEVRPILGMTKGNWIAVREYEGRDLLYFTHLEAWRCGISRIRYAVNGGPLEVWEVEPCYTEDPAPNAMKAQDRLPFTAFELQSVSTVDVEITYDDGEIESASFERAMIMTP